MIYVPSPDPRQATLDCISVRQSHIFFDPDHIDPAIEGLIGAASRLGSLQREVCMRVHAEEMNASLASDKVSSFVDRQVFTVSDIILAGLSFGVPAERTLRLVAEGHAVPRNQSQISPDLVQSEYRKHLISWVGENTVAVQLVLREYFRKYGASIRLSDLNIKEDGCSISRQTIASWRSRGVPALISARRFVDLAYLLGLDVLSFWTICRICDVKYRETKRISSPMDVVHAHPQYFNDLMSQFFED